MSNRNRRRSIKKSVKNSRTIDHHTTPMMTHPSIIDRQSVRKIQHVWSAGDSMMNLAAEYYDDSRFWYVIAWFNMRPTDAHIELGTLLYIPVPLGQILPMLRSF